MCPLQPSEIWKAVDGYEGFYEVSDMGRVQSMPRVVSRGAVLLRLRGKVLRQATKKSGHRSVMLYIDSKGKRLHVHRLVLQAFSGPPPEPQFECAHGDGNPSNNRVTNLRWATTSGNHADKVAHGTHNRGEAHPLCTVSDDTVKAIRSSGLTASKAAGKFGVSLKYASAVLTGATRKFA